MNAPGSRTKLKISTLLACLLAIGSFPVSGLSQVNAENMRDLGYEVTDLGIVDLNGMSCRKLRLDNVPGVVLPFPKMIMLVRQEDNYPLQVEYYDEKGMKIKTLQTRSIERINDVPTSMKMTMKNHLDGTETNFDLTINYEE